METKIFFLFFLTIFGIGVITGNSPTGPPLIPPEDGFGFSSTEPPPLPPKDGLECVADIAFIIDSSRTIYPPDYYKALRFLRRLINHFHFGPDNVRIAAVSFGHRVITDTAFGFDKYHHKQAVLAGIKAIRFRPELGDHTYTYLALDYARKNFFANARPFSKKIAIVLTDGRSDYFEKTMAAAVRLKSQGVVIISIGVGWNILEKELHAIASSYKHVFKVNSYGALQNIIRKLGFDTCNECEGKPVDIGFIIDSSRTIYPPDYYKALDFVRRFINHFQIGPDNVRIAAVSFGHRVITDTAFGFDKYSDKEAVLAGIKAIRFRPELGDHTNTYLALDYALRNFFVNARPNVRKVAVILTDGRSDYFEKTMAAAVQLICEGVEIIAIGVGSNILENELRAIADSYKHVFKINSYGVLQKIIRNLGFDSCKDKIAPRCMNGRPSITQEIEKRKHRKPTNMK